MNKQIQRMGILFLLLLMTMTNLVAAQQIAPYSLLFWTDSNGNGASHAGIYTVADAIGQPFLPTVTPSLPIQGQQPSYSLRDGFWAEPQPIENLLLLYVNGDNDLWPHMKGLINKIQQSAIGANAAIVMLLDGQGERDSYLYRVTKDPEHEAKGCNLYDFHSSLRVQTGDDTDQADPCHAIYIPQHNMEPFREDLGNPNTLAGFLTQGITEYPAAKRILVAMIGHGGGWSPNLLAGQPPRIGGKPGGYGDDDELGGLLWDSHSEDPDRGTSLSTPELGQALRQVYKNTGRRIDLLYLDACLMGMWEVAAEIQEPVHYLLTSESWSWTTFAYDRHINALQSAQSIPEIGEQWIRNEVEVLCPRGNCRQSVPYTYSLLDLNATEAVSRTLSALGDALRKQLTTHNKVQPDAAFRQTSCFDSNQDFLIDHRDTYCDLYSFATAVERVYTETDTLQAAAELKAVLTTSMIVTETHQSGILPYGYPPNLWSFGDDVRGLSIYLPLNMDRPTESSGGDYGWKLNYYNQLAVAPGNRWDDFLYDFVPSRLHGPDCDGCTLPPSALSTDEVHSYRLYLPIVH